MFSRKLFLIPFIGILWSFYTSWAYFEHKINSDWGSWYCYDFIITANPWETIDNWNITFDLNQTISQKWNANFNSNNWKYTITPLEWNKTINNWWMTNIGFCIKNPTKPANIVFTNNWTTTPVNPTPTDPTPVNPTPTNPLPAWDVTISYPQEPKFTAKLIDRDLNWVWDAYISNTLWNIASSNWTANMSYDNTTKKLSYSQDLTNIVQDNPAWWVNWYPEIYVWQKLFWSQQTPWYTELPVKVSGINTLDFTTKFTINNTSNWPLNMAAEGWIIKDKATAGMWPQQTDIEYMIMFYKENTWAAWSIVWEITTSVKLDWVDTNITFDLYKANFGWNFFTFVPRSNINWKEIQIDLAKLLPKIKANMPENIDNFYFMDWEIWSEFGSPTVPNSKFSWIIDKFDIKLNASGSTTPVNPPPTPTWDVNIIYPQDWRYKLELIDRNLDWVWDAYISPTLWNIASSNWTANMSYSNTTKKLSYYHDLTNIVQENPSWWVHWYPEIYVWQKLFWWIQTPWYTELPVKISDINTLNLTAKYKIENLSNWPLNFATEWWIIKDKSTANWWPQSQDVEYMISLVKENMESAWNIVDTFTTSIKINWVDTNITFDLYRANFGWNFFIFTPRQNVNDKEIQIDLAKFLPKIKSNVPFNIDNHYLMSWHMWSEFGSPTVLNNKISWVIDKFDLKLNASGSITPILDNTLPNIFDTIEDNEIEERLTFKEIVFTSSGFTTFKQKFDAIITQKIQNFEVRNYNEIVLLRNNFMIFLKQYENWEITKKNLISKLKPLIKNLIEKL